MLALDCRSYRRPGRRVGADRELSRLSDRHFRPGAGRPGVQPGAEVRRRGRHPARGVASRLRRPGAAAARSAAARADRRPQHPRPHRGGRLGRALPAAEHSERHGLSKAQGVSYWASAVEAKLCEGEEVALVGGGNSAGQAVVFLAPKVKHVHLGRAPAARSDDVALSDRPHQGAAERVALHRRRGDRPRSRRDRGAGQGDIPAASTRATSRPIRYAICSCSSAPTRMPIGWPSASRSMTRASSSPAAISRRPTSRSTARRCRWKPASPACSRSATCAPARPSGSAPRSARAPRWWRRSTPRWRTEA